MFDIFSGLHKHLFGFSCYRRRGIQVFIFSVEVDRRWSETLPVDRLMHHLPLCLGVMRHATGIFQRCLRSDEKTLEAGCVLDYLDCEGIVKCS